MKNQLNKESRRGGFYWKLQTPYISVTNVLKIIDKSGALMYWFGKQVYLAVVKNPEISEKEALRAPYDKSDTAKSRGTTVHSLIEAQKEGNRIDTATMPKELIGYVNAFYKWVDEHKPEIIENEKTVFSDTYKFAGTCDMVARIDGKAYVIDFKTSKDGNLYQEIEPQLSAYKQALEENGIKIDGCMGVGLAENGTTTTRIIEPDLGIFLSAMKLWVWKNKDDCKTLGFQLKLI